MKKTTSLLLLVLFAGTLIAHAQNEKSNDKVGGIRAGWRPLQIDGCTPDVPDPTGQ